MTPRNFARACLPQLKASTTAKRQAWTAEVLAEMVACIALDEQAADVIQHVAGERDRSSSARAATAARVAASLPTPTKHRATRSRAEHTTRQALLAAQAAVYADYDARQAAAVAQYAAAAVNAAVSSRTHRRALDTDRLLRLIITP